MKTYKQLIEQFLQFINTGDAAIGKPIISDDVIFYAPTSPEPMKGFESYMGVLTMMRDTMPDIQWKIEETISEDNKWVPGMLNLHTLVSSFTMPSQSVIGVGKS